MKSEVKADYYLIHIVGKDGVYRRVTATQNDVKKGVHNLVKHYNGELQRQTDYDIVAITQSNFRHR